MKTTLKKLSELELKTDKARSRLFDTIKRVNNNVFEAQEAAKVTYGKAFETALENERIKMEHLAKDKANNDVKNKVNEESVINISAYIPKGAVDNNLVKKYISTTHNRDTLFGIEILDDEDDVFHFGFGYILEQFDLEDDFDNYQTIIRFLPEGEIYKDKIEGLSYIHGGEQMQFPLTEQLLELLCLDETSKADANKDYLNIIQFLFSQPLYDLSIRQHEPKMKELVKEWSSKSIKFKNLIGPQFGFKTVYSKMYEPKSETVLKALDTARQVKKKRDSRKLQLDIQDTLSKSNMDKSLSSAEQDELNRLQSAVKNKKVTIRKKMTFSTPKAGTSLENSLENSGDKLKRAELIKSSQVAGNTAGTPELKRILNNLVKHKIVTKEIAKSISK